ncbi:4-amino-4-deoxy-L-arabinose-phosphoundecaprenol flippase subunit ArnF [archaeon]|nr:4-amino-4-deoxy-L-arabinose-phosphoundecaprenol flippase subunit ArnF [archaeon]
MNVLLIGFICALLGSVAQILFKFSTPNINFSYLQSFLNGYLIIGFIIYGIAFILYIYALRNIKVSILYSTIAMSYVFVLFLSHIFLKEKISYWNYMGAFLIVIGITFIMKT